MTHKTTAKYIVETKINKKSMQKSSETLLSYFHFHCLKRSIWKKVCLLLFCLLIIQLEHRFAMGNWQQITDC